MRHNYLHTELALPGNISFNTVDTPDVHVNQAGVNNYVDSLQKPTWYTNVNQDPTRDTRFFMLNRREFRAVTDPFNPQRQIRMWRCESCRNGATEGEIELGHIQRWRDHLKYAGVESADEARAAYNNLNNLKLECRLCNASHDWE